MTKKSRLVRPFVTELDDFASRYLKQKKATPISVDLHNQIRARVCEDLVFCSTLTVRTFGENVPLAMLCNWFGPGKVLDLLREGALEFVLWDATVTRIATTIPGMYPLQTGRLTSPIHSDPEVSAMAGLEYLRDSLPRRHKRRLIAAACDRTRCVSNSLVAESVEFAHKGFEEGLFAHLGLPGDRPITELENEEKQKLAGIAASCLNLAFVADNENDFHRQHDTWEVLDRRLSMIPSRSDEVTRAASEVLRLECFPSLYDLVRTGQLDVREIPQIRASADSRQFRKWLADAISDETSKDICQEYVATLSSEQRIANRTWFRTVEVMLMGGLSVSPGATQLSAFIVAAGLTALDHIIVDKLLSGWTPRRFIERQIGDRVNQSQAGPIMDRPGSSDVS